jgi:L-amino acid N-acyltransferase YncA
LSGPNPSWPAVGEYAISVATVRDLADVLDLQKANLIANGGSLSVEFTQEWFERSIAEMPMLIARRADRLAGYVVSSTRAATRHLALSEAKFSAYPASLDACNSGPLCIATSERGRGLSTLLLRNLTQRLGSREAAAFIRRDNLPSRHAHARAGFREVAEFSYANVLYVVAVYKTDMRS